MKTQAMKFKKLAASLFATVALIHAHSAFAAPAVELFNNAFIARLF